MCGGTCDRGKANLVNHREIFPARRQEGSLRSWRAANNRKHVRDNERTTIVRDPIPLARSLATRTHSVALSAAADNGAACLPVGTSARRAVLSVSTGRSDGGQMRRRACVRSPAPQAVGSASRRARLAPRA
jgi:hypothetical protein